MTIKVWLLYCYDFTSFSMSIAFVYCHYAWCDYVCSSLWWLNVGTNRPVRTWTFFRLNIEWSRFMTIDLLPSFINPLVWGWGWDWIFYLRACNMVKVKLLCLLRSWLGMSNFKVSYYHDYYYGTKVVTRAFIWEFAGSYSRSAFCIVY